MFSRDFQLIVVFFSATVIVILGAYAAYCRRRAKSYVNTGRLTDIHTWAIKSTIMWIVTFVLAFAMAAQLMLS
jgi:hypothetical protein